MMEEMLVSNFFEIHVTFKLWIMKSNKSSGSQGEPNIDLAQTTGDSALAQKASGTFGNVQLIVEKEKSFEEEEEELADKVESWGVYIPSPEKTLVGLFWDKEIAEFFKDALQKSPLINTLQKAATS